MDERLKVVAEAGDINALYVLFREFPDVLKNMDDIEKISMVDTPLHVAAVQGHTHFAVEMISLKPSFGRKLNPDGLSPLHLALRNGHTETVLRLINIDSELIRVQGKARITPLHHVAETNESSLLAEFLCACPASIKDLTVRGETALHIAVKKESMKALKVLLGWLRKFDHEELRNWKDEHGNTALHIAASIDHHQLEVVKLLINNNVDKNARNLAGKSAFDLCEGNEEVRNVILGMMGKIVVRARASKASTPPKLTKLITSVRLYDRLLCVILNSHRSLSSETRESLLVVAVLIVTATYQIVLQAPGGFQQQDNNLTIPILNTTNITAINSTSAAGMLAMPGNEFNAISSFNSAALAAGIGVICLVLPITYYTSLLVFSLLFLTVSYTQSMCVIAPTACSFTTYLPYVSFGVIVSIRLCIRGLTVRIIKGVPVLCRYNLSSNLSRMKSPAWLNIYGL